MKLTKPRFEQSWFLFLLPAFFILHTYREAVGLFFFSDALELILYYFIGVVIVAGLFFLVLKSWRKASLFVTFFLAFNLFFGSLQDFLRRTVPNLFLLKYTVLIPVVVVATVGYFIYLKYSRCRFHSLAKYLNFLLTVFLLLELVLIIPTAFQPAAGKALPPGTQPCDTCAKPDVYLILADEYAGKSELQEVFGYDNSPFLSALRSRGFFVSDSSYSNYNFTPLSMASLLNMKYLDGLDGDTASAENQAYSQRQINNSIVCNFFAANSYTIKNFSIFNLHDQPTKCSQNYLVLGKDLVLMQTFPYRVFHDIGYNLFTTWKLGFAVQAYTHYIERCNKKLLAAMKEESGKQAAKPRFVYTHLLMPHYPFYYNHAGVPYPNDSLMEGMQVNQAQYLEYLRYCNNFYINELDELIKKTAGKAIIILMSDHGFRHFETPVPEWVHYSTLNAVFYPSKTYDGFPKAYSNVNQFRVILNTAFDQHLPYLKDSTIFIR